MTHIINEDETYTFEILQEKYLEESSKLLAHVFIKHNPMDIFMKITYEKFYPEALAIAIAVLDEKLSIVIIHKQTNEIHGVVLVGDLKKAMEHDFTELEPTDDSEIYNELKRRFIEHYGQLKENDVALIMMVGIHEDCGGKGKSSKWCFYFSISFCLIGLGTQFQQILLNHCRQCGFKHAIVETSNPAMNHIYTKKLNGKEFTSIDLPTFVTSNGRRPFEHYEGNVPLIVFDLHNHEK